jgi:hypothetical protein
MLLHLLAEFRTLKTFKMLYARHRKAKEENLACNILLAASEPFAHVFHVEPHGL